MIQHLPITNEKLLKLVGGLSLSPAQRDTFESASTEFRRTGHLHLGVFRAKLIRIAKAHGHLCPRESSLKRAESGKKTYTIHELEPDYTDRQNVAAYDRLVALGQRQLAHKPPLPRSGR